MVPYQHYITVNDKNQIIQGFSTAFKQPKETDICINNQGSYQFKLFPQGEDNPALFSFPSNIPLYKYENNTVIKRSEWEIKADTPTMTIKNTPNQLDVIEAQVVYTALMTNTLLEGQYEK